MPKLNGHITRNHILEIAENLFSNHGFDATSVDKIAEKAKVNKATIYYHFKNKKDLLHTMFDEVLTDLNNHMQKINTGNETLSFRDKFKHEILFLEKKKNVLSLLMMESLKNKNEENTLFKLAEKVIGKERLDIEDDKRLLDNEFRQKFYMHEFFTGFMVIINFIIYKKKWCIYYQCNEIEVVDIFLDSFFETHVSSHIE